jgi:PRC-barrel domain protein
MKTFLAVVVALIAAALHAEAQLPGSGTIGLTADQSKHVSLGKSVKKDILGKTVYNDQDVVVGTIEDVIVTPEDSLSYAVVGVGGFLGVDQYDVAIPIGRFKTDIGKVVLIGASKESLEKLPRLQYSK